MPTAERSPSKQCLMHPPGKRAGRPSRPPRAAKAGRPAGPVPQPAEDNSAALELLTLGDLAVEGRLAVASNATLYCRVRHGRQDAACVYKPVAGERPLWDFAAGSLAGREVAAYKVSQAAGWNLVPPTVFRDGPFGPGMCQLWIDADTSVDLIALARSADHRVLRDMAVFDAVVNNADRKIGHLLPVSDGRLFGCDHGVCFSEEYKLRTVLWQWRGQTLPKRAIETLTRLQRALGEEELAAQLSALLTPDEVAATIQRVELLLDHRVHPYPPEDWPAVPWPPV
jgi:uncharacterized repeat protein (TIGR03843 family)